MRLQMGIVAVLILAGLLAGILLYGSLPMQMAMHWGVSGKANGGMPRLVGILFMPVLTLLLTAFLFFLPRMDPLGKNVKLFQEEYEWFLVLFAAFFTYVHALILVWNMGIPFSFTRWLMPALAVFFFGIGVFLPYCRRNYFIGIRTPWTLHDDTVWKKTHLFGGAAFKLLGVLILLGLALPSAAFFICFLVALLALVIAVLAYSYFVYKNRR